LLALFIAFHTSCPARGIIHGGIRFVGSCVTLEVDTVLVIAGMCVYKENTS